MSHRKGTTEVSILILDIHRVYFHALSNFEDGVTMAKANVFVCQWEIDAVTSRMKLGLHHYYLTFTLHTTIPKLRSIMRSLCKYQYDIGVLTLCYFLSQHHGMPIFTDDVTVKVQGRYASVISVSSCGCSCSRMDHDKRADSEFTRLIANRSVFEPRLWLYHYLFS